MIVDGDGALENSTDAPNLLVGEFNISMENNGDDSSWIDVDNERKNISIPDMVRSGLTDSNQHENKW